MLRQSRSLRQFFFDFNLWIHPVPLIMTLPSPWIVLVTLTWKMFSPRIVLDRPLLHSLQGNGREQ